MGRWRSGGLLTAVIGFPEKPDHSGSCVRDAVTQSGLGEEGPPLVEPEPKTALASVRCGLNLSSHTWTLTDSDQTVVR